MQAYGDYTLLVGMAEIQKKVNGAIISSNFSEILSYFDGSMQSREKYFDKLTQMLADLNAVATHPFLLLPHMLPNLASKRAANLIEEASGKFDVLVHACKQFTNPEQHVAIICKAGLMTDLVEVLLNERGMSIKRYSATGQKTYKREAKTRGAQFHLLPSHIGDLSEAAYVAFDAMILLEEQFDVDSDYGRGLRLQLRDPTTRHPYAPVLRLLTSNTVEQLQPNRSLSFAELLATAVCLRTKAGSVPPEFKKLYQSNFAEMKPFFANPELVPVIPATPPVPQASRLDVERTLYLDDADQYQVNFTSRRKPGTDSDSEDESKTQPSGPATVMDSPHSIPWTSVNNVNANNHGTNSGHSDNHSGQSGQTKPKNEPLTGHARTAREYAGAESGIDDTGAVKEESGPRRKRRRMELEPEVEALLTNAHNNEPLAFCLLVELNKMMAKSREDHEEVASHQLNATKREAVIDKLREDLGVQVSAKLQLEKDLLEAQQKAEKFRVRNASIEQELSTTEKFWEKLQSQLQLGADESARLETLASKVAELEDDKARLTSDVANERTRYNVLKGTSEASDKYAEELKSDAEKLKLEISKLNEKYIDAPAAQKSAVDAQLAAKDQDIRLLKAEIDNLRESVKVQFSQERGRNGRPTDRRTGRGRGRATAEAA